MINRRLLLKLAGFSPLMGVSAARADDLKFAHAVSLFGDIKYQAGFKNFDYVNADALKGGRVRLVAYGTFDSLNPFTIKGDPAAVNVLDTLMAPSMDEPATEYGLIAESMAYPEDKSRVVFRLNSAARFHDGKPITPEDVIFSLETVKNNLPTRAAYYKNVQKAEQTGENEVTFVFDQKDNRELPYICSQIAVMPKHWWSADGRDTNATTLEIPLGSGPYKFKDVKPGSSITLERVKDYWAKDLSVNRGQNNFDEISYIYFATPIVAFEAFKGDQYDYQYETSSKQWATGYEFPAVKEGRVVKELIPNKRVAGMQGYVINLRKPKFQDVRVRRAMNLAYDFEFANANLFFGQYKRSRSYFNKSELEATGLPSADELALLEPLKDKLPPEVFTAEYQNPTNPDAMARRKNLREAARLLSEAGWIPVQDGGKNVLKNAKAETLTVGFVLDNPLFERVTLPYKEQLELLGFVVTVRTVDDAQMTKLRETFDYDVMVHSFGQSESPGNEQRFFWASSEADKNGSQNYAGIKNEAIDALIEKLIFTKDRAALVTACRALDRALIWGTYVIPQWFGPNERIAHWDRFGRPEKAPDFGTYTSMPMSWWWDEAKAKKVAG